MPRTWVALTDPPPEVRKVKTREGALWTRMGEEGHYWSAVGWESGVSWAQVLRWGPVTEVVEE